MLPLAGRPNVAVSHGRFNPVQCPFNGLDSHYTKQIHCPSRVKSLAMLFNLDLAKLSGFQYRVLDCHPIRAGQEVKDTGSWPPAPGSRPVAAGS